MFKIKEVDPNNCKANENFLMFFKETVVPVFEYGLLIYGGTTLNKLQKMNDYNRKF